MNHRLQQLRENLYQHEIEAILISTPENRRYLSGFTGSAGYLLISQGHASLVTDFRYVEQAGRQSPDFEVERVISEPFWLPKLASKMGAKRVGFESLDMTVSTQSSFNKAVETEGSQDKVRLVATTGVVEDLRAIKDETEIKLITRAAQIADLALERVEPIIQPGITEMEVAWELEKAMRENGAEAISFDIIVGAGPNGALPHHRAGDKIIKQGESIVIDMGARFQGYCSDLTRTVFVGPPDDTFRRVYDTVLRAQLTAEEKIAPGMTGSEVDKIARDIIAQAGYGENFGHSLGHGVGLAVHEHPRVAPNSEDPLREGMVLTVEPGIYLSGWGGVRIEDMVVLENGRARIISHAPKLTT